MTSTNNNAYNQLCLDKLKLKYDVGIYTNPKDVEKAFLICRNTLIQEFESECKKITTMLSAFSFLSNYSKIVVESITDPKEYDKIIRKRMCKIVFSELTKNNLVNSQTNEIDESFLYKLMYLTDALSFLSQNQYNFYLNNNKGFQLELLEDCYAFTLYDKDFALKIDEIAKQMKPDYFKGRFGDECQIIEFREATIDAFGDVANRFYNVLFSGEVSPDAIIDLTGWYKKFQDNSFLNGLLLRKKDVSLLASYKHPQSAYRSRYRPILQLCIGGKQHCITTPGMIFEALSEHITNQLPFGILPNEWKNNNKISEFAKKWKDKHGQWLDDEVQKILEMNKLIFLRNIKSIDSVKLDDEPSSTGNGNIGEIDFIVVNTKKQNINVIEDKFIKTTYDSASFGNDKFKFTQGKKAYEKQLLIKFEWIKNNLAHLENELKKDNDGFNNCISNYSVKCCFVTNSPTYYRFFSKYPIFPVNELSEYLKK